MKKYIPLIFLAIYFISSSLYAQKSRKKNKDEQADTVVIKLYPIERHGYYGYVDENGRKKIDYDFDYAGEFSEGFAHVQYKERYGYINKEGDIVIKCKYDDATPFKEGLGLVLDYDKYGFINQSGEVVIEFDYDDAEPFKNGVAYVMKEEKEAYIDHDANVLSSTWYDEVGPFFRGICKVIKEGKIMYMSKKGKIVRVDPYSCFDQVLTRAEKMPEFLGGDEALQKFFQDNIIYPDKAGQKRIEGTVFLRVEVRKDGKISNIEIISGIGGGCDEETVRIANKMPAWIPARHHDKPVCITTIITVEFKIDMYYEQVKNR